MWPSGLESESKSVSDFVSGNVNKQLYVDTLSAIGNGVLKSLTVHYGMSTHRRQVLLSFRIANSILQMRKSMEQKMTLEWRLLQRTYQVEETDREELRQTVARHVLKDAE